MLFNKASIVQTLADKIDSSVRDVFLNDETELEFFEDDKIAGLVSGIPGCTQDDITEKDVNKVVKAVSTEASYNPIDDIVNGGYEESLFRGMSEEAGDNPDEEKLEAEERRLEKYARTAKGAKKASYGKKIDEIEEEKKKIKESYDSIDEEDCCIESIVLMEKSSSHKEKHAKAKKSSHVSKKAPSMKEILGDKDLDEDEDEFLKDIDGNHGNDGDNDEDDEDVEECSIESIVSETELSTETRKELPTKVFGIPEDRKFPLHDKAHVSSAITYFRKAAPSKRKELAGHINAQARKFGMKIKVSSDNPFHQYADKSILED